MVAVAEGRAERGVGEGHVDTRDEVLAVALEPWIGGDGHEEIQIAGRTAAAAGVPPLGEPDPLAVLDPRRDRDVDRIAADLVSASTTDLARRLRDLSLAAAAVTDLHPHELAEDAP